MPGVLGKVVSVSVLVLGVNYREPTERTKASEFGSGEG